MMKLFVWALLVFGSFLTEASAQNMLRIGEDEVKSAIEKEFNDQGLAENVDLEFFGGKTVFEIPGVSQAKIMVDSLSADETGAKFRAQIIVFADGEEKEKSVISGKYYLMGEAFVPARNLAKGEVIKEEDLRQVRVRMNKIKSQYVVEKESLVGQEAKKSLKEGRMVSEKDIGSVVLIHKGDTVTSVYQTEAMQITAKCEALEDGGKGDGIEVMNLKSKKTIHAKVIDKDSVAVEVQ